MSMSLLLFLLIPVFWFGAMRLVLKNSINFTEMGIGIIATSLIVWVTFISTRYSGAGDIEFINGQVTKVYMQQEDCPWGWRDSTHWFCTEYRTRSVRDGETCTGTGKDRRCTPKYKTQYNYDYDWERKWFIDHDQEWIGWTRFEIRRIDSQGVNEPPFHTQTQIGDPVAIHHDYSNWVMAAGDSLFNRGNAPTLLEQYADMIPGYPLEITDYFMAHRVLTLGVDVNPDTLKLWNYHLGKVLTVLGPERQMNAVVIIAKNAPSSMIHGVQAVWNGFKKNDAVIIVSVDDNMIVQGVQVESWSKNKLFNVNMREEVATKMGGNELNFEQFLGILNNVGMSDFERYSMSEFEYLKNDIPLPWLTIILCIIMSIVCCGGLTMAFHNNDISFSDIIGNRNTGRRMR